MDRKKIITDPCYEEQNFRKLLEVVFLSRKNCEKLEKELLNRILFDGLLEMNSLERLQLEISGDRSNTFLEDSLSHKDLDRIRGYQRTPKHTWDILNGKRGYILDSKNVDPKFKISWKEVKKILFLDPPDELSDGLSIPGIRFLAQWRINCYEMYLKNNQ